MSSKAILIFFLAISTKWANGSIVNKVIYGTDDRSDLYQNSDQLLNRLALSSAALIPNELLIQKGQNFLLTGKTLRETGVCAKERFASQLTSADCSGFLIGADILATAGHCVQELNDCKINYWVFDYANITKEQSSFSFSKDQIYHCTEILAHSFGAQDKSDFSIVKLDRPVTNRAPLLYRTNGKLTNEDILAVIGHPSGVPTKITTPVEIRDNSNTIYFTTDSDTFTGNSGGAVINIKSGLVEGILIRGDIDYVQFQGESCRVTKVNAANSGRGEDVMRINSIPYLRK